MPVSPPTSIHSSELNEGASDPFDTPVFTVAGGADNFVTVSIAQRFSAAEITTPPALYDDSDDSLVGAGTLIAQDGSPDGYVGDWGWTGVPAGDYYIRVTGVDSYHIEVLEYTGVDQATPTSDAQAKSYNDAGPPTTDYDVTSSTGDMVIASVVEADGTTVTESQTLVAEDTFAYGGATHNIQRAAGASTVNMDWTGLVVWASVAYNIRQAAGGPTTESITADLATSSFDVFGNVSQRISVAAEALAGFVIDATTTEGGSLASLVASLDFGAESLADNFTVYVSALSELVTSSFDTFATLSGAITSPITAILEFGAVLDASASASVSEAITATLEWGAEASLGAARLTQQIATTTLEWGVILLGTMSGVVPLATDGDALIKRSSDLVRRNFVRVRRVIREIVRRY